MGQPYQTHWGREVVEKNWEEKHGTREIEFQFSGNWYASPESVHASGKNTRNRIQDISDYPRSQRIRI